MIILSHRGFWKKEEEKNTVEAFENSFSENFGIEIDVRDFKGELVVSHDMANDKSPYFSDILEGYKNKRREATLAINIKADGLQRKLKEMLQKFKVTEYFVFDMSMPDGLIYIYEGLNVFGRQSEYETEIVFYDECCGVWMDEFKEHWISERIVDKHIKNGKKVCIVSPELHKRSFEKEWEHYKEIEKKIGSNKIMICTDYPEKARRFFNE